MFQVLVFAVRWAFELERRMRDRETMACLLALMSLRCCREQLAPASCPG